jgi:hypothetical protein
MERIVCRVDLDPDGAAAVERALGLVHDHVVVSLGQDPPTHTKRALEAQREHLDVARREVRRSIAEPIALDDQGDPVEL